MTHELTRPEWQSREGFLFIGDVALQLMDDLRVKSPVEIPPNGYSEVQKDFPTEHPANASLQIFTDRFQRIVPQLRNPKQIDKKHFGITEQDLEIAAPRAYGSGLAELNFTWHFAPAIASSLSYQFVDQGFLKKEQMDSFSLADWANIIGSGWFSKLMHTMAYTRNGVYEDFGKYVHNYKPDAFLSHLGQPLFNPESNREQSFESTADLFEISEKLEPEENALYTTASLSRPFLSYLRSLLDQQKDESSGCPVARYGVTVPEHMVRNNPHITSMLAREAIRIVGDRPNDKGVRLRMDWSPIDAALAVLAQKMDEYDRLYGTPRYDFRDDSPFTSMIKHEQVPAVDALRRVCVR